MSPIGDISTASHSASGAALSRARALQKSSAASDLHSELGGEALFEQKFRGADHGQRLHRSGTVEPVPYRNGHGGEDLRLVAPCVAQLLGQIMPDPETPLSQARSAYG